MGIPIVKIMQSTNHVVFKMKMLMLVKCHLYIELKHHTFQKQSKSEKELYDTDQIIVQGLN